MSISRAFSRYSKYCEVMVAMGMSLMSICCLRIRSSSRSSGPSYWSRWKLSGDDTIFHDSMGRTGRTFARKCDLWYTETSGMARLTVARGWCVATLFLCRLAAAAVALPAGPVLRVSTLDSANHPVVGVQVQLRLADALI